MSAFTPLWDERLLLVNEWLVAIASCGRQFFHRIDGTVAQFAIDGRGRLVYLDRCDAHAIVVNRRARWRGFSEGSTLKWFVEMLADYVRSAETIPADCCVFTHWGYGDAALGVIETGRRLGVVVGTRTKPFTQYGKAPTAMVEVTP
jgi:hypothetical protein